jgi:hypothetical protein
MVLEELRVASMASAAGGVIKMLDAMVMAANAPTVAFLRWSKLGFATLEGSFLLCGIS